MLKLLVFDQNHGLTPLEKYQFFDFVYFFFNSPERRFFFLKYCERILLAYFVQNKKMQKLPIFDQKYGLTPLEKSHFLNFLKFCFLGLERRFLFLEYRISWPNLPKIKKLEKLPIFDQNHGLVFLANLYNRIN